MNFITEYISLLMQHPLATPVASLGLLALTLHLVLPLLCEIWRYYPNKITGLYTVDNWYYELIGCKITHKTVCYYNGRHCEYSLEHETMEEALNYVQAENMINDESDHSDYFYERETKTPWWFYFWSLLTITVVATVTSLLIEYLLANFFIHTLVAGLAVGLHFTVVLLGKKLYSVSEDVKALKEHNEKEKSNDD